MKPCVQYGFASSKTDAYAYEAVLPPAKPKFMLTKRFCRRQNLKEE